MFRFGEPLYLYLLIVVPILAAFYFYSNYRRRKRLKEYGDMSMSPMPPPYRFISIVSGKRSNQAPAIPNMSIQNGAWDIIFGYSC